MLKVYSIICYIMNYKNIKDYEHYEIYEDGKIYNTKTKNYITWQEKIDGVVVALNKNNIQKGFKLSRLIYNHFANDEVMDDEAIIFVDGNKKNFHCTNLKKIKKIELLKQQNEKQTIKANEKKLKLKLEKEEKNKPIELDNTKEWKFMKDNNEYKISNYGDVYSIKSNIILKANLTHMGYNMIRLYIKNVKKDFLIHRLVYDTFKGIKDNKKFIDHIDRNKLNNHIDNLREVTGTENNKNRNVIYKTRQIYQHNLNDELIKLWNSVNDIIKDGKYSIHLIKQNCKKIIENAHGFVWSYVEKEETLDDIDGFVPVKTDDNKIYSNYKINRNGVIINNKNKVLSKVKTGGYYTTNLTSDDKIAKFFKINRLVAITFIDNPNNYPVVNHIDENKLNDNVENLEWCTYSQNSAHSLGKKINQIDIETNKVINTFNSISDAQRFLGEKCRMNISEVCRGLRNKAYGYKWSYVE